MIEFFENSYKDVTNLTQGQIRELAVCNRLDEGTLSELKNFYREKNPLLFEKSKDTLKYRLLYGYNSFNLIPIVTNYVKGISENFKIQTMIFNFIPIIGEYLDTRCQDLDSTTIHEIKLFDIIPLISIKSISIADYSNGIRPNHGEVRLFNKIFYIQQKNHIRVKKMD